MHRVENKEQLLKHICSVQIWFSIEKLQNRNLCCGMFQFIIYSIQGMDQFALAMQNLAGIYSLTKKLFAKLIFSLCFYSQHYFKAWDACFQTHSQFQCLESFWRFPKCPRNFDYHYTHCDGEGVLQMSSNVTYSLRAILKSHT